MSRTVVIDCVNPVEESRFGWRQVAARTGSRLVEIELTCSDAAEHRRRVEARIADIPGHRVPAWDDVVGREFEPWRGRHLVLDTAATAISTLLERCETYIFNPAEPDL